ncbi:cobaltochelatase subunit CobN, partial [Colwellia marinimaniae]|uniref:cobaltochelatase subunit CobN n=1 Tax=Colwellia marinimaniae TaxID=1513592 RepID=UPI00190EEFD4
PQTLPRTAIYHPYQANARLSHWQADWNAEWPVAAVLFYRSHLQAANTGFIDVFCQRLQAAGLNPAADGGGQFERARLPGGGRGSAG